MSTLLHLMAATALALPASAPAHAAPSQALPNGTILFSEGSGSTPVSLGSVGFGGQDTLDLVQLDSIRPSGMAVDPDGCHLYFVSAPGNAAIERVDLDGTDRQVVAPGVNGLFTPTGVDFDPVQRRLYWLSGTATRIGSCDLSGGDMRSLVQYNDAAPSVQPRSIHVDATARKLYWWDAAVSGFRRCNLDGSVIETVVVTGTAHAYDVDTVGGWLYWSRNDELCRATIDGSVPPTVILYDSDFFDANMLSVDHELGIVAWSAINSEVRWTAHPNFGAVQSTGIIPGTTAMQSLEIIPGPRVRLSVSPSTVQAGTPVDVHICSGAPGAPYSVFFGGTAPSPLANRFHRTIVHGVLDASGEATVAFTVPLWLSGSQMQFFARTSDPLGTPASTRAAVVTIL